MTERDMQHGHDWRGEDLAGWIVTEKLDGCRAYWDGSDLWTRGGIRVALPDHWRAGLPAGVALDCELYDGPGGRYRAAVALRFGRLTDGMCLMAFDAPAAVGTYTERMAHAAAVVEGSRVCVAVESWTAGSTDDVLAALRRVQARGGEGLMARHPALRWEPGRARMLLKVKHEVVA